MARALIATVILSLWLFPAAPWSDAAIAAADGTTVATVDRLGGLWRGRSELVRADADGEMVMNLHRTEQGYAGTITFHENQGDIVSGVIYGDGTAFVEAKVPMEGREVALTISGDVKDESWDGVITLADANGILVDTASFALEREADSPAGGRLPAGILAHASAKSLDSFLANLDSFAAACVMNTPVAAKLQPGTLSAVARMAIGQSLPPSAWDSKGEIHAVVAIAQPMAPYQPNPVIILKIPGMAAFKKAMTDNGANLEGDGEKLSGQIPGLNSTWHFADIGGGGLACSPDAATLDFVAQALASGWSPKHRVDADIAINVEKSILAGFRTSYEQFMGELKQTVTGEKSDDALQAAVRRVAAKVFSALEREVPVLGNLGIDLSFNKDRLKATLSLSGDKGSGIDALRVAYAGGERPKYALVNSFPGETVMVAAVADPSRVPEGWRKFHEEALRELADGVMPERAERFADLARRFFALGIRDFTAGSYLAGDRLVVATYFRHGGAKEVEAFLVESLELGETFLNNLAGMLGGDNAPSFALDYDRYAGKIGNVSYQRVSFRITPPGGGKAESCDFLFALGGKTVAGVFGQVGEGDLKYAIDNHQRPPTGFLASESVGKAMAGIDNRRIKMVAIRPLPAAADLFIFAAAMKGADPTPIRTEAAELLATQATLAMAAGATDKALTFECVVPAELIGDCVRYADTMKRLQTIVESTVSGASSGTGGDIAIDDEEGEDWDTSASDNGGAEDWDTSTPDRPAPPAKSGGGISGKGKMNNTRK